MKAAPIRTPFHVYIDECFHFGTATITEMLLGIRKFGVSLVLGHQYLDQLPPASRSALIGTTGTLVSFRLGMSDAEVMSDEFHLTRDDDSLTGLRSFAAYAKTSGSTYRLHMPATSARQYPTSLLKIVNAARHRFAAPRESVETKIKRFIDNT